MKKFDVRKIKEWFAKVGGKWRALAKRTRVVILAAVFVVLGSAIIGTVLLNHRSDGYKQIFPGMTSGEATEVYATLQEMGASPQMDSSQRVYVPESQWETLIFELNSRGYPKTTLSYDTFSSAAGFTSTEFQQRVALIQQQQDRCQQTLMRQDGIIDAVVTFYVPETSNYIWDQNNQEKSTANVSVRMASGKELTAARVSAIKHLAATSVPKLSPEDVTVIDAATGVELLGSDQQTDTDARARMLELEQQYANILETKARRLLSPMYGADGVTAVATVELDFDKLVTETKQYQALEDGDGGGVRSHYEEGWTRTGNSTVGGIVGEENNDDVPTYPYDDDNGDNSTTDYSKLIDYNNSYILTQLEKGQGIRSASIAVIVNDNDFTNQKQDTLIELVAKGVNLDAESVMVTNLTIGASLPGEGEEPTQPPNGGIFANLTPRQLLIIGGAFALILLLILLLAVIASSRGKKQRRAEAALRAQEQAAEQRRVEIEQTIADHKKKLQDEAMATIPKPEENAIAEEVRNFAEANPEITAALIRSMMKEES